MRRYLTTCGGVVLSNVTDVNSGWSSSAGISSRTSSTGGGGGGGGGISSGLDLGCSSSLYREGLVIIFPVL